MTSFPSKPFTTMAENFQLGNGKKTQNHFQSYSHFILSYCTDILATDYKNLNMDSIIFRTLLFERCWHVQANTIKSPGSFNIKWALDSPILICSSGVVNFTDKLARLGITPSTLPGFFFKIQPFYMEHKIGSGFLLKDSTLVLKEIAI